MNINDHKLLRKLIDDLRREHQYDNRLRLQLDSGMVAEVRFVEPATLSELVNASPEIIFCACGGVGVVDCASACSDNDDCPHDDGRCCDVCAHYNGGKLAETCYHCSMLSHWQESELTDAELEALVDESVFPVPCATCRYGWAFDGRCVICSYGKSIWEPRD